MPNNIPAPADLVEAVKAALREPIRILGGPGINDEIRARRVIAAYQAHMASDGVCQMDYTVAIDLIGWLSSQFSLEGDIPPSFRDKVAQAFAAHRRAAAGFGREPVPGEFNDEALDWITANGMAIRRDNGDMDYSLGAMVKAFEAGKAAATTPQPDPRDAEIERLREALTDADSWLAQDDTSRMSAQEEGLHERLRLKVRSVLANSEGK